VAGAPRVPALVLGYTRLGEPALARAGRAVRGAVS
jgi:hypothetical protein